MTHDNEHELARETRKLHTPDPSVCGRKFLIVDWADRLDLSCQSPVLCQEFLARGSNKSDDGGFEKWTSHGFDPRTYRRAVFGYIDGNYDSPFLVDDQEICDSARIMHNAHDASANYLPTEAKNLLGKVNQMRGPWKELGNPELETLLNDLHDVASQILELLSPGKALLDSDAGVDAIVRSAVLVDSAWNKAQALSDELFRQHAEHAPNRFAKMGWLKSCDFYPYFGRAEGELGRTTGDHTRDRVSEGLKSLITDCLELRKSLKFAAADIAAHHAWLKAFTA